MKTKTKMIFSAVLAAALIALPRAQAATSGAMATNAPMAATATAATNSKPTDVLATLFGDPVSVRGTDVEITQSQLDEAMDPNKSRAAAAALSIPPEELTRTVLNNLIGS